MKISLCTCIEIGFVSSVPGIVNNFACLLWDQAWEKHGFTVSRSKLLSRPVHGSALSL